MDTMTTDAWRRRGSGIIFDRESLADFIADDRIISLRQALAWLEGLPAEAPGRTIVIAGLETVLDTGTPEQAEALLRGKAHPLLRDLQRRWPECGVVFGFAAHPKCFAERDMDEAVLFRRGDRKTVRLSEGLWGGGSAADMRRIVRESRDGAKTREEIIGYHVARIS